MEFREWSVFSMDSVLFEMPVFVFDPGSDRRCSNVTGLIYAVGMIVPISRQSKQNKSAAQHETRTTQIVHIQASTRKRDRKYEQQQ